MLRRHTLSCVPCPHEVMLHCGKECVTPACVKPLVPRHRPARCLFDAVHIDDIPDLGGLTQGAELLCLLAFPYTHQTSTTQANQPHGVKLLVLCSPLCAMGGQTDVFATKRQQTHVSCTCSTIQSAALLWPSSWLTPIIHNLCMTCLPNIAWPCLWFAYDRHTVHKNNPQQRRQY